MKFPHEFSSWSTHYYRHVEPKSIYPENNTKRPWQFPWKSGNMIYNPPTIIYIFSTLPTAAAPHRCLIFGQKWRSVELCRSDRIIRNEESKAGTTIGWNFRVKRLTYQEGLSAAYFRNVSYWPHCYLNFCSSCKNLGNVCFLKANAMFCTNLALHIVHVCAQRCSYVPNSFNQTIRGLQPLAFGKKKCCACHTPSTAFYVWYYLCGAYIDYHIWVK